MQDPAAGLQVFAPDGKFLRNVTGAPSDFHGFVIHKEADGEFIYGATLRGQTIVKMTLEGDIVMTIGSASIPDQFKVRNARSNQLALLLTGLDVAPNGDLYVTDGYASDYIHRFDKTGKYLVVVRRQDTRPTASTRCTSWPSTRASRRRASSPATAPTTASCTCRSTASSSASSRRICCCRPPSSSTATTPSSAS